MTKRSILGLMYSLQGLRSLGEDVAPVLARHGLDLDRIDPSARIDRTLELRIHCEVAEVLRDPLAGLKSGRHFSFAGYGPLSMLLITCANAGEAFACGVRYQRLTYLYSSLSVLPGDPLTALCLEPPPLPGRAFRFRVDGEMSGTYKLIRDIQASIGVDLRPQRVDLPYPRPPEAAAYESHFGCPVQWDEAQARFWFRRELLQLRFPAHDPATHALYRRLCDEQLVESSQSPDRLAEQVRNCLQLFDDRAPSAARVARYFGLAERTLRRRLAEEGLSFRALAAEARYRKARELLENSRLSIEAISDQLGYAEPAAFIHAFQRWAGRSPQRYRSAKPSA